MLYSIEPYKLYYLFNINFSVIQFFYEYIFKKKINKNKNNAHRKHLLLVYNLGLNQIIGLNASFQVLSQIKINIYLH